ncbi:MAG: hypothetical protein Q4D98_08510 [Planctomycetia bacterium]|nr:hypothetical protein [Planctomycetia bacterium]
MTGALTSSGTSPKEILLTGSRSGMLLLNCELSGYTGTITTGSSTDTTKGTWVSLNGAKDASGVTFHLNSGDNIDTGLLLNYTPTEGSVMKIGALSGNGIVRSNIEAAATYSLQIGGNNQDATFSGSIHAGHKNSNYVVEKVGTGTWTITSDETQYNTGIISGYKNAYTGDTTITEGTLRLGDYDPTTKTGGETGQLGMGEDSSKMTKIVIGENGTFSIARNSTIDFYHNIDSNGGTLEVVYNSGDNYYDVALRRAITGSFVKTGAGTLSIGTDDVANLTKITIQEGTLLNFAASRLGNGSVTVEFTGGTFSEYNAGTVLPNEFRATGDGTLKVVESFTITGALTGTGTLTQTGGKTLTLAGGAAESTANLNVTSGTLELARTNAQHAATNLTLSADTTLLLSTANQSISGNLTLADGATIQVDLAAFESDAYLVGDPLLDVLAVTGTPSFTLSYSGEINRSTSIPYDPEKIVDGLTVPMESLQAFLDAHMVGGIPELVFSNGYLVYNTAGLPEPTSWMMFLLGWLLWRRSCTRPGRKG